jgi:hypothetical protein
MALQQLCGAVSVVSLPSKNIKTMEQKLKNANSVAGDIPSVANKVQADALQPMGEMNRYSELENGLKNFFGEDFDISDKFSQDLLLQHLKMNKEQNDKLAETLERDPRLAQLMLDVIGGKRNAHSAMARYFGNSFMTVDEDSPEFEEIMMADEERKEEIIRLANDRHEYEKNLTESIPVIEEFCKEKGYEASDFMDKVWDTLVFPILAGKYSKDVCIALDHAITYDKDVEDAFVAGDIKGRNTNIQRMKEEYGDGMPKGMNSVAPDTEVKRKRNSLIDKALNA